MRDPKRIEPCLQNIGKQWAKAPDWRLGQLIVNAMTGSKRDLFFIEDDVLIERIKQMMDGVDLRKAADQAAKEG